MGTWWQLRSTHHTDKSCADLTSETEVVVFASVMSLLVIFPINVCFQRGKAVLPYKRKSIPVDDNEILKKMSRTT